MNECLSQSDLEKQKNWNHPKSPSIKDLVKKKKNYGIC